MTPELAPGAIDDDTLACGRAAAGEKRRMITVGHEADLVTVGFLGNPETELTRMLAHLQSCRARQSEIRRAQAATA